MEKMLTLEDVSIMLGYKKDGQYRPVRKLRKDGILRSVKIGKKILFKESDVEEYIEHQYRIQNKIVPDYKELKYQSKKAVRSAYDENIENLNKNNEAINASKKQIKE